MKYLSWNEKTITDFSEESVAKMYDGGFVFTRIGRGEMQQTRSLRIDLARFELSSENRRILNKTSELNGLPTQRNLPLADYNFLIAKMAKNFYDTKFGPGIMSAQKAKEMLTDIKKSNFNSLLTYSITGNPPIGFSICYESSTIVHYSYPFYDLATAPKDMGMGMMIRAIQYAKESGKRYIYLGSLQRPGDVYKLQFSSLEWFDGEKWREDIEGAKEVLSAQ